MSIESKDITFTDRQIEIIMLMSNGMTNKQIATELHIKEGTVKNHIFVIYRKLGVNNRIKAITKAKGMNLFPTKFILGSNDEKLLYAED